MISNELTIVIPSKNEGFTLEKTLWYLNKQKFIYGTNVVIADSSDDEALKPNFPVEFYENLRIHFIKGGYPAAARRYGSVFAKRFHTRYILFLDADMFLTYENLLSDIIFENYRRFDLLTVPYTTEYGYNIYYRIFDFFQWISAKFMRQPFAIGGFQVFDTEEYWRIGGYNADLLVGEDYEISLKIRPSRFRVHKSRGCYTSARRLKNKGVLYMGKLMLKSWWNRKNPDYFKKHHNYWN